MAGDLQSGFKNNLNIITIRTDGTSTQRVTDRPIDIDNDGDIETVTITQTSGHGDGAGSHKVRYTVTKPAGIGHSVVQTSVESNGGIDITGSEFTKGNE